MRLLLAIAVLALAFEAWGRDPRQRDAFRKVHPCPATGQARGACPGYVVDHKKPLCAGGADHPANMQWQTVADAKVKDREEVRMCRASGRAAQSRER